MAKYRIVEKTRKDGNKEYYIQHKVLGLFWMYKECGRYAEHFYTDFDKATARIEQMREADQAIEDAKIVSIKIIDEV